ncbi:MAG: hypothetical protein ACI4K9_01910 [Candidatus Fimenecus sp.]
MDKAKKRLSAGRICGIFLGAVIFILFTPLVSFVLNSGSVFGMAVGILIVLCAVFSPKIKGFLQTCRPSVRTEQYFCGFSQFVETASRSRRLSKFVYRYTGAKMVFLLL